MYTKHKSLGKFEGNESEKLARAVYNTSLNGCCEELGDVEGFGFYAYIQGKKYDFVLSENSQGFIRVWHGTTEKMSLFWQAIENDYEEWNQAEAENANAALIAAAPAMYEALKEFVSFYESMSGHKDNSVIRNGKAALAQAKVK